jgi:hypothetical protein
MPLSKLVNNSLGDVLRRNLTKPKANAVKLPGQGNVPGVGAVGANGTPSAAANIPGAPTFAAATTPGGPQYGEGSAPGGTTTDPRDPTYFSDLGKIQQYYQNTAADYDRQQTLGQQSLTDSLNKLNYQHPIDIGNARGSYNNAGLFYSTRLSGAEGDIEHKYADAETGAKTGFKNLVDSLDINRNRLKSTYGEGGTEYQDALGRAVGRQSDRDAAAAQLQLLATLGQGGGGAPAAAAPPTPGGMVNGQFQSTILSPGITSLINEWINKPRVTKSTAQKTTGR